MAVYFDYKVKSPVVGHNTDIQWHKSSPLLAVASYVESTGQGQVNLFMEEVSGVAMFFFSFVKSLCCFCTHVITGVSHLTRVVLGFRICTYVWFT